jgi:hypothetical protein
MNLNISEHYKYNQYKEKLNEIFDKLDEVIYISNTIDYKKITILLAEIVQNFDYYEHHKEKLAKAAKAAKEAIAAKEANDAEEKEKRVVGGKRGRRKVKGGVANIPEPEATPIPEQEPQPTATPEETPKETPEPPQKPYSLIDAESINHIKEGEEYKKLLFYIDTTKERINNKGTKLMEKVKDFIKEYLQNPERNSMIYDDYIKQHSNLEFKLKDIISNIDKIEDGIQKETTEYAKIYVDLMSNKWCSIKDAKYLSFITICANGWYYIKKQFIKNAHVIEKGESKDDLITKEDYKDFVEDKLYKLYLKLHKEFPKDKKSSKDSSNTKATPTEDFDTIIVLFKDEFQSIKVKIAEAKEEEATVQPETEETEETPAKQEATSQPDETKETPVETPADETKETKATAKPAETPEAQPETPTEETPEAEAQTAKTPTEETPAKPAQEAQPVETPAPTKETKAQEKARVAEEKTAIVKEKEANARAEAQTAKTPTEETPAKPAQEAQPVETPAPTKETKAQAKARVAEEKTAKVEEKTAKARAEAITDASNIKEVNAQADEIITEARIESTKKAKELADKTKADVEAKAAEMKQQAEDARKKVVEARADTEAKMSSLIGKQTSQFNGLANSLTSLKKDVGAEAKQTKDLYANIINKKNKLNPIQAKQEFTNIFANLTNTPRAT